MEKAKALTVRLSAEQANQLDTVAAVDGRPVSEVIRIAIAGHISRRKRDSVFQDGLKQRIKREQHMLLDDAD